MNYRLYLDLVILLILFLFYVLVLPSKSFAQVVINEVMANPESSKEWIEFKLTSTTSEPITLTGWTVWDMHNLIFTFGTETINNDDYLIIEINNRLNNDYDEITLKDNTTQSIDQLNYQNAPPGESYARLEADNELTYQYGPSSRGTANPLPTPTPSLYPSPTPTIVPSPQPSLTPSDSTPTPSSFQSSFSIILSEIMACPEEGNEWIELYNPHSTSLDLSGFKILDNTSLIYSFNDMTIPAIGFISIDIKSRLNNTQDQVILQNPHGDTIDFFSYQDCEKGSSYIFYQNSWHSTLTSSRNQPNILTTTPTPSATATPSVPSANTTPTPSSKKSSLATSKLSSQPTASAIISYTTQAKDLNLSMQNASPSAITKPRDKITFYDTSIETKPLINVIITDAVFFILGSFNLYAQVKKQIDFIH